MEITLIVVGVIVLLLLIFIITTLNKINKYGIKVEEARSAIEIALVKRYDTLVESVKAIKEFSSHEGEILTQVAKSRKDMNIDELSKSDKQQVDTINRMFAIAEQYPDLRSSEMFVKFQNQLTEENSELAATKRVYNSNASIYNQTIVTFPIVIVALIFGKRKVAFIKEDNIEEKKELNIEW